MARHTTRSRAPAPHRPTGERVGHPRAARPLDYLSIIGECSNIDRYDILSLQITTLEEAIWFPAKTVGTPTRSRMVMFVRSNAISVMRAASILLKEMHGINMRRK